MPQGNVTALHMRISGQSIVAGVFPQNIKDGKDPVVFQGLNPPGPEASIGYTFPALLIDHAMRNPSVPPGFWRGVNLNQNTIYLECFIDELAHATGQDPLAFRRKLMANHPKHLAVLNAAAEARGLGHAGAKGVYRGLAQTMGFGSYVAACAEVSVSDERHAQDSSHRRGDRSRVTPSIRSRSRRRSKARSRTDCRRRCTASAR